MVLGDVIKQIPMAALVGVMFMVAAGTFDWQSLKDLTKYPLSDAIVMVVTVVIVLFTHNLALGVMVGIVLSTIVFSWKMAKNQNNFTNRRQYEAIQGFRAIIFLLRSASSWMNFSMKQTRIPSLLILVLPIYGINRPRSASQKLSISTSD